MDELLPLADGLRTFFPPGRGGAAICPATAWRWATKGASTPAGGRAHLRLTRIGSRLFLRRADAEEFIAACSARDNDPAAVHAAAQVPPPAPRADTAAVLDRAGIRPAQRGKAVARGR